MTSTISATAPWKPSLPSSTIPSRPPPSCSGPPCSFCYAPRCPRPAGPMPEPAPDPDGKKLLDSAIIEQDYDSLPGLCNIERDDPVEMETPTESAASEPPPPPELPVQPPSDVTPCNQMQHDSQNCDDVAPAPSPAAPRQRLRSCPAPPDLPKAPNDHQKYLELLDMIKSIEQTPIRKIEKEDPAADAEANEEEILV